MARTPLNARSRGWIAICVVAALIVPWSLVQAEKTIQERRAADPQGEIEIVNVSGTVEVDAWDRSEVEVGGTAGDNAQSDANQEYKLFHRFCTKASVVG